MNSIVQDILNKVLTLHAIFQPNPTPTSNRKSILEDPPDPQSQIADTVATHHYLEIAAKSACTDIRTAT